MSREVRLRSEKIEFEFELVFSRVAPLPRKCERE